MLFWSPSYVKISLTKVFLIQVRLRAATRQRRQISFLFTWYFSLNKNISLFFGYLDPFEVFIIDSSMFIIVTRFNYFWIPCANRMLVDCFFVSIDVVISKKYVSLLSVIILFSFLSWSMRVLLTKKSVTEILKRKETRIS